MDGARIRQVLLETIKRGTGSSTLQSDSVLYEVARQLKLHDEMAQQALLTMFHDLFRTGHLAWGLDINNTKPPFFHITEQGRRALQHLSRDPMNPDGYMAYLSRRVTLGPIPTSYITEALRTYNADY